MKKSIILLFVIVLAVVCLASCEFNLKHEHIQDEEWSFDVQMHYKNVHCTWNVCKTNVVSYEHVDEDGNLLCDVCGFEMSVASNDIEWLYSETHHWWVPEGYETVPAIVYGYGEHENFDADLFCDICGYDLSVNIESCNHQWDEGVEVESGTGGYVMEYTCSLCGSKNREIITIIPPEENHFIRNQAGAEWLCQITADDVAEIKMISGGGGPLPPVSFTHISSSTDKAVISSIFEEYYWLDSKPVTEEKTQIADGGYFIVQFILNDGTIKEIYLINGDFYHDGNSNYFEIVRLPVFRYGTNFVSYYGFEIWDRECSVYLSDGLLVAVIPTSELEFIELADDIELGDETPTHYIEMNGVRINFLSEYHFYIGDDRSTYYQLIGKTLNELIAENAILYD